MPGYFRVYRDTQDPKDIHFEQVEIKDDEKVPEDQLAIRDEVDRSLTTIRLVFSKSDHAFERYFRPLLSLAQLGLVGTSANPALAMRALSSLHNEIVAAEGGRIKNEYLKILGKWALALGLPALSTATVIEQFGCDLHAIKAFLLLWTGCMMGVWLSFGARKIVIQFYELGILENDRLNPPMRLVFAGAITVAIGLILSKQFLVLEAGKFSSKDLTDDFQTPILIGIFCGLSELALSSKLVQHASDFLSLKKAGS